LSHGSPLDLSHPSPASLNTPRKVQMAQALYDDEQYTVDDVCKMVGVSKATLYRYVVAKGQNGRDVAGLSAHALG
jgi:hypothetical protein